MDRVVDFEVAGWRVKVTEGQDQLLIWTPHDEKAWAAFPPQLHGELRADHVSIPLKPKREGDGAGCWRPHLTYPDGQHRYLVEFPMELLIEKLKRWEDELRPRLLKVLRRTTPEELEQLGYRVIPPMKRWFRRLAGAAEKLLRRKKKTDKLVLTKDFVLRWWEILEATPLRKRSPLCLRSRWAKTCKQPIQVEHHELEDGIVYYFPKAGGWFIGPRDMSKVIADLGPKLLGPGFYEAVFQILRELQVPGVDPTEIVERMRQMQESPADAGAHPSHPR